MKVLRIVATVIIVIVVVVALLIGVALLPAVQTWAVRRAVATQPGLNVDRVAAGFTSADLTGIHVVQGGMVITATHVSARYSAWDFIAHRRVTVDDLTVENLVVDTRNAKSGATATSPAAKSLSVSTNPASTGQSAARPASTPFNGVLNQIQLPFEVQIARFDIPGRVLLPNEETADFDLRGSDLTTGKRGTVDWKVDVANHDSKSPWSALHSTGTAAIHITTERRIDEADVNALASAEGPKVPADQVKFDAKVEQPAAGGTEGYSAKVTLVHDGQAAPLLTLAAQFDASVREISGAWDVSVHSQEVQGLLAGLGLPDVSATGAGKFSFKPDTGAADANGEIQSDVAHLEKFSAELGDVGGLHLQVRFNGGVADNVARLEQFSLEATTADGRRLADITTLQRIGFSLADQRVSFANAQADLARIAVQDLPLAWAQPWVKALHIAAGDLSLSLAVAAAPDGSRVRITPVEPLTLRNVTLRNGAQPVFDRLTLTVKPQIEYSADQVQAQLTDLDAKMPTGDTVNGKITVDVQNLRGNRTIAFTADTQARVVAALKPYLPADAGPLLVVSRSQGSMKGSLLRFDRSTETVSRASTAGASAPAEPLLRFDLQQPITIDTTENTFSTARPEASTARMKLAQVPLAWAAGFVKGSTFAGAVAGGTVDVTLRSVTDITATTAEPISVRSATVTLNGQPMVQDVDATVDFSATKKGDAINYQIRQLSVDHAGASLLQLVASGDATLAPKLAFSGQGRLHADLAALMQQPTVASYASLSRGIVDAAFDADVAQTIKANVTLKAQGLVAKQDNRPLGDATLNLTAAVQSDGSSTVQVPFTLTNGGRRSDVMVDGKLARTATTLTFDGRITSNQLFADDLQPLAALAPGSKPATPPGAPGTAANPPGVNPVTATTRPTVPVGASTGAPGTSAAANAGPDQKPFWNGIGGKIDVDMKEIRYGRDTVIRGVRGNATITPVELALNSLQGQMNDNPFKIDAKIDFKASQPQPYTLDAAANIPNFDIGAILQAANPGQPPQLETKVTVNAKVNGQGTSLPNLAQNAYGVFDVTGSKGVLRALAGKVGKVTSGLSTIAGLIGAAQNSQGWDAAAGLTQKLSNLPFDRFAMHVERGADLNLKVSTIEFVSPDTHILGSGSITNQPGVPIQNQPMRFTLQLAGKDDMAVLLQRTGLLGNQQDNLGYTTMNTTFTLSGSPAKPNSSDLWRIIGEAAAKAAASRFLGQ